MRAERLQLAGAVAPRDERSVDPVLRLRRLCDKNATDTTNSRTRGVILPLSGDLSYMEAGPCTRR